MPEKTLKAISEQGKGTVSITEESIAESHKVMDSLKALGVNIKDVTDKLEADGVAKFIASWDSVIEDVQKGIDRVNA